MPTLRIEFIRYTVPKGDDLGQLPGIRQVVEDAELPIRAEATKQEDWPTAPPLATHALLHAVGGPCFAAWTFITNDKKEPDPSTPGRKLVTPGEAVTVAVKPGVRFSCIAANLL